MTDAIRDTNHVPVALGVSTTDSTATLPFKINSTNGKLVVSGGGVDGSFTTVDGKTVTVTKGIITAIV